MGAFMDTPCGREGSGACGAVGIGTGAVFFSIPEGSPPLTGVRVEPAAGPFGPGRQRFCPGPTDASRTGSGLPPSGGICIVEVLHRTSKSAKVGP